MVKYNKIDDGAKEAIIRVLKKKSKLVGGDADFFNNILESVILLIELTSKYGEYDLLNKFNDIYDRIKRQNKLGFYKKISNIFDEFREAYGNNPYFVLSVLSTLYPNINDDSLDGSIDREMFTQKVKKLKLSENPNNTIDNVSNKYYFRSDYDASSKEEGFILERKFYDEFFDFGNRKYITDLLNPINHFARADFKIDGRTIELKGRDRQKYEKQPRYYFIGKQKFDEMIRDSNGMVTIVWAEYPSLQELLVSRGNTSINYYYFVYNKDFFDVLKDNHKIGEKDVSNEPHYNFRPSALLELKETYEMYDTQRFIEKVTEAIKDNIDQDDIPKIDKIIKNITV